jgi:hypothetical protein
MAAFATPPEALTCAPMYFINTPVETRRGKTDIIAGLQGRDVVLYAITV